MIPHILCCSSHGHIPKNNSMTISPFLCSVLIETSSRREDKKLRKAIVPFMTWIDPCLKLIQVSKFSRPSHHDISCNSEPIISLPILKMHQRRPTQTFRVPCPAISIMLFLQENGVLGSRELQKLFNQSPWKLHHRIELVNVHSPDLTLADQRFYQAHTDTPLWAVCPVDAGHEHLRINIFVRNFPAMIEFYRIITGVEMETNKDNFCWFLLYSQPGLEIRLSLKCADNVDPYPLQTVQLLFEVNNVGYIETSLGIEVKFIGSGCYWMTDPDGNFVVLHTTEDVIYPFNVCYKEQPLYRKIHPNEDNLTTKISPSTGLNSMKCSTIPRNFTYFKRNASKSNDSGLFTSSEGSHIEDSVTPAFFKNLTFSNSSKRFTNCNQLTAINDEEIFTNQLSRRFLVDRQRNMHLSFRGDNGHVRPDREHFYEHVNLSKKKDICCSISSLCEDESRLDSAIRRSNSALIDFSKYVIKKKVINVNPEPPIVSEEIFV